MELAEFRKRKFFELDGFRSLAILLVCVMHMKLEFPFYFNELIYYCGWVGVPLFFVLSGFLLSLDYIEAGKQNLTFPSTIEFYKKRILRIFPLYFFSLGIYIIYRHITHDLPSIYEVFPLFIFLNNLDPYQSKVYPNFWSLAVEVQVYALFPLIGYGLYNFIKNKKNIPLFLLLASLILVPLAYRIFITNSLVEFYVKSNYLRFIYCNTLSNLDSFGFGIIVAVVYTLTIEKTMIPRWLSWLFLPLGSIIVFCLMHYSYSLKEWKFNDGLFAPAFYYSLLNTGWGLMILAVILLKDSVINKLFSARVFRFVSMISYSMYVWHGIIYELVTTFLIKYQIQNVILFNIYFFIISIILVLGISSLTWYGLEVPFLRMRTKNLKGLLRLG